MRHLVRWTLIWLTVFCLLVCAAAIHDLWSSRRTSESWRNLHFELFVHRLSPDVASEKQDFPPKTLLPLPPERVWFGFGWNTVVACSPDGRRWHLAREFFIPVWLIAAVALVLPLARAVGAARRWRGTRRVARGLCPACTYDLTGNVSGACPECGSLITKGVI